MVHNVEFSCSHISFVWLHGLNSLQWWLLTCPDLTNVVWFKNNIDQHEYPKQLQAHPAKKSEIPDTRNTRWFWKKIGYGLGIAKNYRVGSGIGYPSDTVPKSLKKRVFLAAFPYPKYDIWAIRKLDVRKRGKKKSAKVWSFTILPPFFLHLDSSMFLMCCKHGTMSFYKSDQHHLHLWW
jgi:hypothetical protein